MCVTDLDVSIVAGEPNVREEVVLVFRDHDDTAKAVPLSEFLTQHQLNDLHEPTPLDCLALKERLAIADDHWKYVVSVFDLCMCMS